MADLLAAHHDAVQRLAEVPGLGVDSAQQVIAQVGVTAATFASPKHLASWMGACPGTEESAGKNYSHRWPKGNRQMRRVLNQAANAAVKAKETIFAVSGLIWKILHERVRYEERGPSVSAEAKKIRTRKILISNLQEGMFQVFVHGVPNKISIVDCAIDGPAVYEGTLIGGANGSTSVPDPQQRRFTIAATDGHALFAVPGDAPLLSPSNCFALNIKTAPAGAAGGNAATLYGCSISIVN